MLDVLPQGQDNRVVSIAMNRTQEHFVVASKIKFSLGLLLVLGGVCVLLAGCNTSNGESASARTAEESPSATNLSSEGELQKVESSVTTGNPQTKEDSISDQAIVHTARKVPSTEIAPTVPKVYLSPYHQQFCKLLVGESFPLVKLPSLSKGSMELKEMLGKQATVILVWKPDRWMAQMALADIQREIAKKYPSEEIGVIGILVSKKNPKTQQAIKQANASFPQLLDRDGQITSSLGSDAYPRVYVLGPDGKVAWFDIEYSEGTHRELLQCISALTTK